MTVELPRGIDLLHDPAVQAGEGHGVGLGHLVGTRELQPFEQLVETPPAMQAPRGVRVTRSLEGEAGQLLLGQMRHF